VFATPIYDPETSPRTLFPNHTVPAARMDPLAAEVLAHYPLPNLAGTANHYVRTAADPDSQDQIDARFDRYFGAHRVFGRYSYFRDEDTPVTPLPDGSGLLSSGVIGHAVTRGDSLAAEYAWSLPAATLNTARFGYTRRGFRQDSMQSGDIRVPGVPAGSFAPVEPSFLVSGYQQVGPTAAANSIFSTSVTEYLDTLSMVRGRHTIKLGADIRREALDVVNPPNPAEAYTFNTTGTNASGTASGGNAVASLLLGQVSAFSLDVQNDPIHSRAHIAKFFAGDEWRVSPRLSVNAGARYTLNFPSTEVHNHGAVFNLRTEVLDFPHTARNWSAATSVRAWAWHGAPGTPWWCGQATA
jgi:hypothetical protein